MMVMKYIESTIDISIALSIPQVIILSEKRNSESMI